MKLGLRRPLTSLLLGAACLVFRLTLEPARWVPRIAAASASHRILILSRAPRAARPYPVSGGGREVGHGDRPSAGRGPGCAQEDRLGGGPAARTAGRRADRDRAQVQDVLAVAASDGGLAGRAGRDRRGDGKHRGVLVAGLSRAGPGRDRGVRVQRGAHAQRPGPQNGSGRLPVDRRTARVRAAAARFHSHRGSRGAASPDPVPQEADRAAHQRGAAAVQGAGGRRDQDRPRWPPGCCSSPGGP
jgi:hypothetical protein